MPWVSANFASVSEASEKRTPPPAMMTGFLAFFTYWLWRSTGDLVRGAEKTAKTQLRAYVFLKNVQLLKIFDKYGASIVAYRVMVEWQNTGKTPTRKARTNINYEISEKDLPKEFSFPDSDVIRYATFGPNQTVSSEGIEIHLVDVEHISTGARNLHIWGWVEYNDVFDNTPRHRTEFSNRVLIRGEPRLNVPLLWEMQPTENHNGSDDECFRKATSLE